MDAKARTSGREVIVVAEDEPSLAALLEYHLTKSGYDVVLVSDGKRALDAVGTRSPRLCLLDVSMPEIPGTEVLRMMKNDTRTAPIPVILLSGDDQPSAIDAAYRLGADDYLVKPVEAQRLLECIETHLRSPRQSFEEQDKQQNTSGQSIETSGAPSARGVGLGSTAGPVDKSGEGPATSHGVQVIDLRTLLDWTHHDMSYVRSAIEDFIAQAESRVFDIASAREVADMGRVADLSHQYQGVLVSFGALQAAATTKMITDAAQRGAGEMLPALVDALHEHVTEAVTALRHWQETSIDSSTDDTTRSTSASPFPSTTSTTRRSAT